MGDYRTSDERLSFSQIERTHEALAHFQNELSKIFLGSAFVFETEQNTIHSCLGEGSVELLQGQVTIEKSLPPFLKLATLSNEKSLFAPKQDVHVLAVDLTDPDKAKQVFLQTGESTVAQRSIALEKGMGILSLHELAQGNFHVFDSHDPEISCDFEVAQYSLAPLDAKLCKLHAWQDNKFDVELLVQSYGQQYANRELSVLLMCDGVIIGTDFQVQTNEKGVASFSISLEGDGVFSLHLRCVKDNTLSASVYLSGTRKKEREELVLNPYGVSGSGKKQVASMVAPSDRLSTNVRGLYVYNSDEEALKAPFQIITTSVTDTLVLYPFPDSKISNLRCTEIFVSFGIVQDLEQVFSEQGCSFDVQSASSVFAIGAIVDGKPWEGFISCIKPSSLELGLSVADQAEPSQSVSLELKTNSERTLPVALFVTDRRITQTSLPHVGLASALKKSLAMIAEELQEKTPKKLEYLPIRIRTRGASRGNFTPETLIEEIGMRQAPQVLYSMAFPTSMNALPQYDLLGEEEVDLDEVMCDFEEDSDMTQVDLLEDVNVADPILQRQNFKEVLFCGIVSVPKEGTVLQLQMSDKPATYDVYALAIDSDAMDWDYSRREILCTKALFADVILPPFVYPGDPCLGIIEVKCESGMFTCQVSCGDGSSVPLTFAGRDLAKDEEVTSKHARITFPVNPGRYHVLVQDAINSAIDVSTHEVKPLGVLEYAVSRTAFLQKGEKISQSESVQNIRPLQGLTSVFNNIAEACALYGYECCVQTADKLVSAVLDYAMSKDPSRRAKALDIALASLTRELLMMSPNGLLMYPDSGYPCNPEYASHAVESLLFLRAFDGKFDAEMSDVVKEAVAMGLLLARMEKYGVIVSPEKVSSIFDAYNVLCNNQSSQDLRNQAVAYVKELVAFNGRKCFLLDDGNSDSNSLQRRVDMAQVAQCLLIINDYENALALANTLFAELNCDPYPDCYTPSDKSEALALLFALQEKGLGADVAKVRVNGEDIDLSVALNMDTSEVCDVESIKQLVCVSYQQKKTENWGLVTPHLAFSTFFRSHGIIKDELRAGERVDLCINLTYGYFPGALAEVALPPCLSRVSGSGGEVQAFQVDFRNLRYVNIPVIVKTAISPVQHFAVIVRDMFDPDKLGSNGYQEVRVSN